MSKLISIIIVNYNSGSFLKGCLTSIIKNVKINYEVIIVDNNSSDSSFEKCHESFSPYQNFIFIQTGENLGFSKGNKEGVKIAKGDIFHFLNPDTELNEDINEDYIRVLENPDVVYVNPLRNPDGRIMKSYHLVPTIQNYIMTIFKQGKKWYLGATIIISKMNYLKMGGWNDSYWLYFEDLDFFYNVYKNKLSVKSLPSIIEHIGGGCSSNVWTNKERVKVVEKAEKIFYKINGIYYQYYIIKLIGKLYRFFKRL